MKKLKPILFFITILLISFIVTANVTNFDFDLWARLIAGMGFIDGGHVLKTDFLSYTPTHTWWDHEYGSGIVFYFFLKHFGAYSLILLQTAIVFTIFATINQITKLRGVKTPYNFIFYFFALIALAPNLGSPIRCHLFSFLFFTIFLLILEISRKGKYRLLYILPFLTIIWNNLHGGVVSGIGLIMMYTFAQIIEKKPFKHYLIASVISFASLIINPWGWEYIKFLLMANTMQRTHVAEWWGLFSRHQLFNQIPFKVFMLLVVALEYWHLKKSKLKAEWRNLDTAKYVVLATTLFLAIQHVKLLPFFVISATAFCYEDFEHLASKFPKWSDNFTCALVLILCLFSFSIKKYELPVSFSNYPIQEVEFIKANHLNGKILVNFGLGSFVSYKLYPQNLIYMDGRYEEVYYDELVELLDKFFVIKPEWDTVLKKYTPDIMIIEKYYPIYSVLNGMKEWTDIFEGETFAVFVKTKDLKQSYIAPPTDKKYYKDTLFDTSIKF